MQKAGFLMRRLSIIRRKIQSDSIDENDIVKTMHFLLKLHKMWKLKKKVMLKSINGMLENKSWVKKGNYLIKGDVISVMVYTFQQKKRYNQNESCFIL